LSILDKFPFSILSILCHLYQHLRWEFRHLLLLIAQTVQTCKLLIILTNALIPEENKQKPIRITNFMTEC
jgi:hypothetical protein